MWWGFGVILTAWDLFYRHTQEGDIQRETHEARWPVTRSSLAPHVAVVLTGVWAVSMLGLDRQAHPG